MKFCFFVILLFRKKKPVLAFWTPSLGRKGPIKYGLSVLPSFLPSILLSVRKFFQNWLISFFWNSAWCWGSIYSFLRQPDYLEKIHMRQKWSKMAQKHGSVTLVLSEICVKWKFLWFINILRKLYAWEKASSQVIAKNGSWPVRFQYFLIVNISLID